MPNDDYIKRSAAEKFLTAKAAADADRHRRTWAKAICAIKEVPSADVEPKREIVPWKVAGAFDDFHQCTECGNMWPILATVEWAYCPICGCRKFPEPMPAAPEADHA